VTRREDGVLLQQVTTCATCRGDGRVIEQPCRECEGRGQVEREETLTVTIPIGVEDGMALRVPGHGLPGPRGRAAPGDLFVVVRTATDPRFERSGADLWRAEAVSPADAVLGASLDVPTLDGHATVTIPPGTQPNSVLRLRGKGLPEFGAGHWGDLYLRVEVHIPERLSAEERELYERLRALSVAKRKRQRA
jgi:molecular chaperone DnaJ